MVVFWGYKIFIKVVDLDVMFIWRFIVLINDKNIRRIEFILFNCEL